MLKNILTISLIILVSAFFSGCSTKNQFDPIKRHYWTNDKTNEITSISYKGTYNTEKNEVSEIQNIAISLQNAANELNNKKIKYFTLSGSNKLPQFITNFQNLVNYCYPDNGGSKAQDFGNKSTSLENKCMFKKNKNSNSNSISIEIVVENKTNFTKPTWSVKQVLKDPVINEYINNAKKDSNNKEILFQRNKETEEFLKKYGYN